MTTGNIGQVVGMLNISAVSNVIPAVGNNGHGNNFQEIFNKTGSNNSMNVRNEKMANEKITKIINNNNKVKSNIDNSDRSQAGKLTEKLADDIRNKVKEKLNISDEELEAKMAELGFTIVDLLNPQNVVSLISSIQNVDVVDIVTNPDLSELVSGINSGIEELIKNFMKDNNISFESVANLLNMVTVSNETEMTEEIEENVAYDRNENAIEANEYADSQIDVIVEDKRTASEDNNSTDTHSEKKETKDEVSNTILNNISDRIDVEGTEIFNAEFEPVRQVDGADIIRQLINSVKVNISNEIQSMEIQLNPESLGKLNLTITAREGVITASITTQNEMVKAAIENQISFLKEQFENQGIKVEEVQVTVANQAFDDHMFNNERNEDNTGSHGRKKLHLDDDVLDDDIDVEDAIETQNGLSEGNINLKA